MGTGNSLGNTEAVAPAAGGILNGLAAVLEIPNIDKGTHAPPAAGLLPAS